MFNQDWMIHIVMTIEQDVQRFKMELLRKMPFYGDIVMRLSFEENRSIKTACTNGVYVYYNPVFFQSLTQGERYFVLLHEVFHVILMHCRRSAGRDPKIWNIACDIIVNQMLSNLNRSMLNAGIPFQKPKDGTYAIVSNDTTTEEMYEKIVADNEKRSKDQKRIKVRKNYVWISNTDSNIQEITASDDLDSYEVGTDGKIIEGTMSDGVSGINIGEQNKSLEELALNEAMIKSILREAIQKNKSDFGSYYIPGQVLKLVESKRLNWKTLLKDFLDQEISDEASYTTPERKYLHMDLILPGYSMTEEKLEEIWAFVDSSGSVGQEELNQFLTQLYRISKEFQCTVNICYWDTKVTDVYRKVRKEKDILNCLPKHSGGTDINCVYDWISENKVKPDVMLILTDGYYGTVKTPSFKPKYKNKTILVISPNNPVREDMKKIGKIATL